MEDGQLVLLVDEVKSRDQWRMARVVTASGDDTHKRKVEVKTANGKTLKRDISKVVTLEIDAEKEKRKTSSYTRLNSRV